MTAEEVFRYYRAYKFFYAGKKIHDLAKYAGIKCPPLIQQRDRSFYYRISQRLNNDMVHALFTFGFFYNPKAHVSELAGPDRLTDALTWAGRADLGEVGMKIELYELAKVFREGDIDGWLYGVVENGERELLPECIAEIMTGELPVDIACALLLIPQPDLEYHWTRDIPPDEMGLGSAPWIDRLTKIDQLFRLHRPGWRAYTSKLAKGFWDSVGVNSLAPIKLKQEPSLF